APEVCDLRPGRADLPLQPRHGRPGGLPPGRRPRRRPRVSGARPAPGGPRGARAGPVDGPVRGSPECGGRRRRLLTFAGRTFLKPKRYFATDSPDAFERRRLALLTEIADPITPRRLSDLGVGPGWRCLDVGAGDGSIARWLAARVGPEGRVVATDLEPRFLVG